MSQKIQGRPALIKNVKTEEFHVGSYFFEEYNPVVYMAMYTEGGDKVRVIMNSANLTKIKYKNGIIRLKRRKLPRIKD